MTTGASEKAYDTAQRVDDFIAGGYDPGANDGVTIETWHAATLLNGWRNYGAVAGSGLDAQTNYRLTIDGSVEIIGVLQPGTSTGGTTVFTLPAAYRPVATQDLAASTDVMAAASPRFTVNTNGDVNCHGIAAGATRVGISGRFSLDIPVV